MPFGGTGADVRVARKMAVLRRANVTAGWLRGSRGLGGVLTVLVLVVVAGCTGGGHGTSQVSPAANVSTQASGGTAAGPQVRITPANGATQADPSAGITVT